MATNEVYRAGDKVSLPVPADTKAGTPLRIGGLNVVTETDRAAVTVSPTNTDGTRNAAYNYGGGNPDGHASCKLDGAHRFDVAFAISAPGTEVYLTPGGALSASATSNTLYGHALTTKAAPSGPLTVRIAN